MNKKNFTGTLEQAQAAMFISPETKAKVDGMSIDQEHAQKPNFEAKSKRVHLLMQPSVHNALKLKAEEQGKSFNDLVNNILVEYLKK